MSVNPTGRSFQPLSLCSVQAGMGVAGQSGLGIWFWAPKPFRGAPGPQACVGSAPLGIQQMPVEVNGQVYPSWRYVTVSKKIPTNPVAASSDHKSVII